MEPDAEPVWYASTEARTAVVKGAMALARPKETTRMAKHSPPIIRCLLMAQQKKKTYGDHNGSDRRVGGMSRMRAAIVPIPREVAATMMGREEAQRPPFVLRRSCCLG